jgi:hypothetical protein
MAIFKPGELVFPPNLSEKLENLIKALYTPSPAMAPTNAKQIFVDKLLNIERNTMDGDIDGEILSRQLSRAINSLG